MSQVAALRRLSSPFVAFLRTLKAVHSGMTFSSCLLTYPDRFLTGVEQANFSRSGKRGGIVRREPVEHVYVPLLNPVFLSP